jgi:phosphopantetheinyl transferase
MNVVDSRNACNRKALVPDYRYSAAESLDRQMPQATDWLTDRELSELDRWRHPARRQAWLRGRWLMKRLMIAELHHLNYRDVEILADRQERRPRVFHCGELQVWPLSISHTDAGVLAAISWRPETAVGVDLVSLEPLPRGFSRLWFSAAERQSHLGPNEIWAMKEAIYKACNRGEPFDPRTIEVTPDRYRYRNHVLPNCEVIAWTVDGHAAAFVIVDTITVARISNREDAKSAKFS